jgi:hypothetical protein
VAFHSQSAENPCRMSKANTGLKINFMYLYSVIRHAYKSSILNEDFGLSNITQLTKHKVIGVLKLQLDKYMKKIVCLFHSF